MVSKKGADLVKKCYFLIVLMALITTAIMIISGGIVIAGIAKGRGDEERVQINDRYVTVDEIPTAIAEARDKMSSEDRMHMIVSIHADKGTDMGLVSDVKQALRQAGALRINYSATQEGNSEK